MSNLTQLLQQQEELARQIEQARQAEKSGAIQAALEIIRANNLSAKDLGFSSKEPKTRKPVAAKYNIEGNLWAGRGRLPQFVQDAVARLGSLDAVKERYKI